MATTDAKPVPVKGAAYRVTFPIFDADGDLVTGATGLDSEVSKDAGTFADCTNEATEIATSSGIYYLDLTSTEMNADTVAVIVKTSSSGAKTTPIFLYPQEAGDIPVTVEAMNAGTVTATAIAADAITDAKVASDVTIASVTGAVGSVTGAVGSVTGNVGGNVVGSVGSVATGGITAASIAADAIGASELAADAVAEIQSGLATASALTTAQTDLTTLTGRLTATRAGYLDNLSAGAVATASALATLAGKFTGITLLSEWLGALAGKQTANSTARTEIRATGAGGGTYDETTDSQEALRDRGDAAWTTGSSVLGSGSEAIRIRCLNGAAPVDGAAVWITTDSAGTNVVAGTVYTSGTGYTSTLMLDPGSYYVWRQANGVNFTNPETITVSDL